MSDDDPVPRIEYPEVRTPADFAAWIGGLSETQRSGSLCIWRVWWGRPLDSGPTMVRWEARGDSLVIQGERGERLTVEHPEGAWTHGRALVILRATRVRYEWSSDEDPPRHFVADFRREVDQIRATLPAAFSSGRPPTVREPAVKLV